MDPPCRVKSRDIRSRADTIVVFQNIRLPRIQSLNKRECEKDISAFAFNSFGVFGYVFISIYTF